MIVLDKVGSPQYMTWLAAPVTAALGLGLPGWQRTARWVLVVAGVTQAVFPWLYPGITEGLGIPATVLAARNVILVVLLVWTVRAMVTGTDEVTGGVRVRAGTWAPGLVPERRSALVTRVPGGNDA